MRQLEAAWAFHCFRVGELGMVWLFARALAVWAFLFIEFACAALAKAARVILVQPFSPVVILILARLQVILIGERQAKAQAVSVIFGRVQAVWNLGNFRPILIPQVIHIFAGANLDFLSIAFAFGVFTHN